MTQAALPRMRRQAETYVRQRAAEDAKWLRQVLPKAETASRQRAAEDARLRKIQHYKPWWEDAKDPVGAVGDGLR
jgi:hypothetical protein